MTMLFPFCCNHRLRICVRLSRAGLCRARHEQIDKESHVRPVGYGAMLAEGFVAFIACVVVMTASNEMIYGADGKAFAAGKIYGNGLGEFMTIVIGRDNLAFAVTFGAMAFSTFIFDTLDVSMRLGRYIVQEVFGLPGRFGAIIGTLGTVAVPFVLIFFAKPGSWLDFWTLFGASNQLLAALTCFRYRLLIRTRRTHYAVPMSLFRDNLGLSLCSSKFLAHRIDSGL